MSWIFVADDGERVHYDVPPQVAELEAKLKRLETAITTAIGRIDNLNDFGDIREVLEWALEEDHD